MFSKVGFPPLDGPSRTLSNTGPKNPAIAGSISVIENHTNSSAQLPVAAKVSPKSRTMYYAWRNLLSMLLFLMTGEMGGSLSTTQRPRTKHADRLQHRVLFRAVLAAKATSSVICLGNTS